MQRSSVLSLVLRSAGVLSVQRHLDAVRVTAVDAPASLLWSRACDAAGLVQVDASPLAKLRLPGWSLDDYLSGLDAGLRNRLWRACGHAVRYERSWHVGLGRDIEQMLGLCAEFGPGELDRAWFEHLLGPGMMHARCVIVRAAGDVVGFSIVLHDDRRLREKLTVVRSTPDTELLRSIVWLETVRFCLERGIGIVESASGLALDAAGPDELLTRAVWTLSA